MGADSPLRSNPLLGKALVAAAIIVLLQVPLLLIGGLLREREQTRAEAVAEVQSNWGRAQDVAGPFLRVPYRYAYTMTGKDDRTVVREAEDVAVFLPAHVEFDAQLAGETRYRGIYEVPVYTATVDVQGEFAPPDFGTLEIEPLEIRWDRAAVVLHVADTRAIRNAAELRWGERSIPFTPEMDGAVINAAAIRALTGAPASGAPIAFSTRLELQGSAALRFAPVGQQTVAKIHGDWPDPSFQGPWLPGAREVSAAGFTAGWTIPYLGRRYPQAWRSGAPQNEINASLFGVNLLKPVDVYRQSQRSLKYDLLFTALVFIAIWMMEVLLGLRLHLIQYLLIGCALCMFYLLELSLAEHIGFAGAYAAAAALVVGLLVTYGWAAFGRWTRALGVGGLLGALYGYLYVLLQIQDYSLLAGALGLFAILAALMLLTRKLDWYALSERKA